ncbi:FkbM family methyltransferase [uncultured Oscillibacter sp.]|uniref:FkbM family methyltransferase n=1 Tax=uncultured Oscillibacter sp. TaxID=876091 RepID=UPI0025F170E8|nr:FkbM family methyltransferase [uncultured Oscillibacter sp.]
MRLPGQEELQKIYNALQDNVSREIYKHRLLYSFFEEGEEIQKIVARWSVYRKDLSVPKICCYGAGAGCRYVLDHYSYDATFIIDSYKTGTLGGLPVISFDDFLSMPDFREYLVLITVGGERAQEEIKERLKQHGVRYVFAFFVHCDERQYFEIRTMCSGLRDEYFADIGALNGFTTQYFLDHFEGGYAYVFEPNPKQFEITKERLREYPQAELFCYGAYDKNTTLRFDPMENGGEEGARIAGSGAIEIAVRRLDTLLGDRPVTFIKMDIEGSELAALRGAERIVREQRPKLAICVYHKPEDIWEIPGLILQYHPDYRLYLRHYSLCDTDTVLYAV